jgi:hypothetical protein
MEKDSHTFLIGLWSGIGGLVVGGLVACLIYLWFPDAIYLVLLSVFGVEIGAVTAAFRELRNKLSKPVLIICIAGVILAPVLVLTSGLKLGYIRDEDALIFPILYCIVVSIMGIIAGFKAVSIKNGQTKGLWTVLVLWVVPISLSLPLLGSQTRTSIASVGTIFPLFGPWATQVARLVDFPNAGSAFHLPTAVLLTVFIFGLVLLLLLTKSRKTAGLALILFMALIFPWYVIGWWQLAYCAT